MNSSEIVSLLTEWNDTLQTGDAKKVCTLYESDGILLPTVSNQVRHNHAEMEDYFDHFLTKEPSCTVDESNVRIFGQLAINSGIYSFTFKDESVVQARFTFVYRFNGNRWMIVEHHSSRMPE